MRPHPSAQNRMDPESAQDSNDLTFAPYALPNGSVFSEFLAPPPPPPSLDAGINSLLPPAMNIGVNSSNAGPAPPAPSGGGDFDVMAQLASQYYSVSRSRSFSAPVIHPSALGSAWQFSDDTQAPSPVPLVVRPSPVLNMMNPSHENAAGAIGSAVSSSAQTPSLLSDLQGLQLHAGSGAEPENEPLDGGERSKSADVTPSGPLPATFLRTICDQLEYYFCDENLLGDLFLLKNMNMDGYGAFSE